MPLAILLVAKAARSATLFSSFDLMVRSGQVSHVLSSGSRVTCRAVQSGLCGVPCGSWDSSYVSTAYRRLSGGALVVAAAVRNRGCAVDLPPALAGSVCVRLRYWVLLPSLSPNVRSRAQTLWSPCSPLASACTECGPVVRLLSMHHMVIDPWLQELWFEALRAAQDSVSGGLC